MGAFTARAEKLESIGDRIEELKQQVERELAVLRSREVHQPKDEVRPYTMQRELERVRE